MHTVLCVRHAGLALDVQDTAVPALSYVAVADVDLLDTAVPAALSIVAVVDTMAYAVCHFTHGREFFFAPATVCAQFSVAARMVR